jgi:hypothetical protein
LSGVLCPFFGRRGRFAICGAALELIAQIDIVTDQARREIAAIDDSGRGGKRQASLFNQELALI